MLVYIFPVKYKASYIGNLHFMLTFFKITLGWQFVYLWGQCAKCAFLIIRNVFTLGNAESVLIHVPTVFGQEKYPFPGMLRLSVGFEPYQELGAASSEHWTRLPEQDMQKQSSIGVLETGASSPAPESKLS